MSDKLPSAGDHIDARCTKCKDITNHTIVAMADGKVAKVECNTCGGAHKYRKPTVRKAAAKSKASTTSAKINKIETEWEGLLDNADPASATPYSMKMSIKNGGLIQHPSFGLGRVINIIKPNKMEVYFRDGVKLLRCSVA
ncbi:MAG: hypothetical protein J7K90_03740 [Desulfuromusa sp.]|nr:hypothetical protein [Desulfuromusa sp.]